MSEEEIAVPKEDSAGPEGWTRRELDEVVVKLWGLAQAQHAEIEQLKEKISSLVEEDNDRPRLARWLMFEPPPAAEDNKGATDQSPLVTIGYFVQYYNALYTGKPGTRAVAIPDCWLEHPALVAELATLTYTWRAAHIGKKATPRDAQYWHDRWRPGFAERLATEWVHPHCLTHGHKAAGAAPVLDRFTAEIDDDAGDPGATSHSAAPTANSMESAGGTPDSSRPGGPPP